MTEVVEGSLRRRGPDPLRGFDRKSAAEVHRTLHVHVRHACRTLTSGSHRRTVGGVTHSDGNEFARTGFAVICIARRRQNRVHARRQTRHLGCVAVAALGSGADRDIRIVEGVA